MNIENFKEALANSTPMVLNNEPQTQVSMFDPSFVGDGVLFWVSLGILIAAFILSIRKPANPIASTWALIGIGLALLLIAKNW